MKNNHKGISNQLNLVIHSTDYSFGFACRNNNNDKSDKFFIKKIENDLCKNLVVDFNKFISKENLQKVNKIFVTIGPANFNASRLIVVLARTLSQQIKCPLTSISSFKLISKRIALNNNIYSNNQSFWIYKKLKRKGFIAGKYRILISEKENQNLIIKEEIIPKIIEKLDNKAQNFPAIYKDKEDFKELLNFSNKNFETTNLKSWAEVLPLYPLSPFN